MATTGGAIKKPCHPGSCSLEELGLEVWWIDSLIRNSALETSRIDAWMCASKVGGSYRLLEQAGRFVFFGGGFGGFGVCVFGNYMGKNSKGQHKGAFGFCLSMCSAHMEFQQVTFRNPTPPPPAKKKKHVQRLS